MSRADKERFIKALKQHKFFDGQSDFFNKAVDALVSQSEKGKPPLAQPLCFLTTEDRDILAAYRLKEKEQKKK